MPYKDREKYLESQRGYYAKDKETYKWRIRLGKHKMSKQGFFDLLEKQDNKCALCNKPFEGLWKNDLHIDHCHETGKVRGLLCRPCNVALGMFGDNEEGLAKALNYIKGELH